MKKFQKIFNSVQTALKYALIIKVVVSTIGHFKDQLVEHGLADDDEKKS